MSKKIIDIDFSETPNAPDKSPQQFTKVKILTDIWDHNGDRHGADTEPELLVDVAYRLLEEGKAVRTDPLPVFTK